MGMKTMVTRGLAVSMVGVVAVMSTANYKGNLKTTLESNLSDLETMLAGYSAKFKDQKAQIAQHLATIGANETTIKNLQDQVKSLTADKTSLTSERNDLKSKLTSIATLLGIPTEGKTMDALVGEISNNITNGAEVSSDELATFKTIAKNLGKTEDEVASMSRNELVVFINAEVNSLNAELDEANAEIVEYEGKIESANTEIARLEGEVGKLQAEIKRLEGIIAKYEADLNALNSKAETIEETYKEEYNNEIKGESDSDVLDKPGSTPEQTPIGGGTPEQPTNPPTEEQQPAESEKTAEEQLTEKLGADKFSKLKTSLTRLANVNECRNAQIFTANDGTEMLGFENNPSGDKAIAYKNKDTGNWNFRSDNVDLSGTIDEATVQLIANYFNNELIVQ